MSSSSTLLKPVWNKLFPSPLALFGLALLLLTGLRAYGYFGSDLISGKPVMAGFLIMWLLPVLFLSRQGQSRIGIRRPESILWILVAILAGAAFALFSHYLGLLLFGKGEQHWFASVAYSYQADGHLAYLDRNTAFIMFTIPAMLASPFGEEVLFRGCLHEAIKEKYTEKTAVVVTAMLFALVHLIHHGIYRSHDDLRFFPLSGFIWFLLMFGLSVVFSLSRQKTQSIWAPILSHSAFNLVMNVTIFYSLMVSETTAAS